MEGEVRIGFRIIERSFNARSCIERQYYVEPERLREVMKQAIKVARVLNPRGGIAYPSVLLDPDSADMMAQLDWVLDYVQYCFPENHVLTPHGSLPRMFWGATISIGIKLTDEGDWPRN